MVPPVNEIELIGLFVDTAISNGGFSNRKEVNTVLVAIEKTNSYINSLEKQIEELTPKTKAK